MKLFYDDVRNKRKGKRIQVDNELQQVKIKDLNDLNNVDMFTTTVRGGKAFVTEKKIRELKTGIAKLNVQKLKLNPAKIIERSTLNMNLIKCKKNGLSPEELNVDLFNMHRIEKTQKIHRRQDDYDVKVFDKKKEAKG